MKLTNRTSGILIFISILIGLLGALPMIINLDETYLMPSYIISTVLFIIGVVGLIKNSTRKKSKSIY